MHTSNSKLLQGLKKTPNPEQKREGEEKERCPSSGQLASDKQQDSLTSILLSSTGGEGDEEDDKNEALFIPSSTITVFTETNATPELVVSAYDTISADISIIKYYLTFR